MLSAEPERAPELVVVEDPEVAAARIQQRREQLVVLFSIIDNNGDGTVSVKELQALLRCGSKSGAAMVDTSAETQGTH